MRQFVTCLKLSIKERNFNYLTKNFDNFRSELLTYARTYFPENINDFSETSVGGMLVRFVVV